MTAVNFTDSPSNGDTVTVGGVTYTYSSANSRWEVTTSGGGGGGLTTEQVQDAVGAQFVTNGSHTGISFSYDDSGDGAIDATVSSAATLTTARTIGGVSFDGSANINLPGVNTTGNQNTTGSAATLTTARTIGGVSFDGSANINLPGVNTAGTQNTTGSAATLTTARTIGGVSFDGSANIDLPGVNTAGTQNTTGSAATLTTARTIGGVSFDGSANIDLPGVNTAGNQNTTGSAATLTTARTIGGVSFDGSANIDLPGVNTTGTVSTTGNAATATALQTARTIHGVSFDGTANIDLTEVIQDTVGSMFTNNTESGITVTYEDSDGTIDLVSAGGGTVSITASADISAGDVVTMKSNGQVGPVAESASATAHGATILSDAIVTDAQSGGVASAAALQHDAHTGVTVLVYWTTNEAIKAIPFVATTSGVTTGTAVDITTNTQTDLVQIDGDDLGRMAIQYAKKGSPTDSYNQTFIRMITVSNPNSTPTITVGGESTISNSSIISSEEAYTTGLIFDRNLTLASSYNIDVTVASSQYVFAQTSAPYNLDVIGTKPTLSLKAGATIVFDQSDSSNAGHQIAIRNSDDSSYTTGVTSTGTPGNAGAKTTWVIDPEIDVSATYKYYCTSHGNDMGNTISFSTTVASLIRVQNEYYNYSSSANSRTDVGIVSVTGSGANLASGNSSTITNITTADANYPPYWFSGNKIWNKNNSTVFDYADTDNNGERKFILLWHDANSGGSASTAGYNYGHIEQKTLTSPHVKTWHGGGTYNGVGNTAYNNSNIALSLSPNNWATNGTSMIWMYNALSGNYTSNSSWNNTNQGWIFEGWSKASSLATSTNSAHDRYLFNVDGYWSLQMTSDANSSYRRFAIGGNNTISSNTGHNYNSNYQNWWHWAVVKPVGSTSARLYLNTSMNSNTANYVNAYTVNATVFNQHFTMGSNSNRAYSSFGGQLKDLGYRVFNDNADAGISSANDTSLTWWATSNNVNIATVNEGGSYNWSWRGYHENLTNSNNAIGSGIPWAVGGVTRSSASNIAPSITNNYGSLSSTNNYIIAENSNRSFFGTGSTSNSYYGDKYVGVMAQPKVVAKDGTADPTVIAWGDTDYQDLGTNKAESALRTFVAGGNATASEVTAAHAHWGSNGNQTLGEWSSYQYAQNFQLGFDPVTDRIVFWMPTYKVDSSYTKPAVKVLTYSSTGNHTNYTAGGATEGVVMAPLPSHVSSSGVSSSWDTRPDITSDASSGGGGMTGYISGITGFLAPYYHKSSGKISIYRVVSTNYAVSDVDDYLGIVDTAVSSGGTAQVKLVGAISDQQSGLTAGRDYFVDSDGTLTTTNTGRLIGRSLSATELLLIDTSSEDI